MTELIRRLDPHGSRSTSPAFTSEGAWLPRSPNGRPRWSNFRSRALPARRRSAQMVAFARWCRREPHCGRADMRPLREHLRACLAAALAGVPVRIGSRRELNPDKSPGQIALQRHAYRCAQRGRRQLSAAARAHPGGGRAPSRGRLPWSQTGSISRPSSARERRARRAHDCHGRQPASGEGARRCCSPRRRMLVAAQSDLRFLIAGDGPRRAELRTLAATLGVSVRSSSSATARMCRRCSRNADLFVLPSLLRGVSERRDRSDGGGAAGGRQRDRRAARSDRGRQDRPARAARRRARARAARSAR